MSWTYRPALDGLRTLAVYLVVLFHCGVDWFDGGFLGVDLFFVLSGFLVSSILLAELDETGRVRLGRFYGRRVRRLLPACLVVVVATSAVFLLLSATVRRLPWVADAQASLLWVANWRFLLQSNDYFAADVDHSPFLHFWSLSIEEQFYFVFPPLLLALAWLRRRWAPALVVGVVGLGVLSVLAQLYWASADANHAYYGTDARIYQLLAGVAVALAWRRRQGRGVPGAPLGWAMLAVLLFTASSLAPFSVSVRGLVAAGASAGLILAVMSRPDGLLGSLLSRPAMTYLGRISYGTYLWHWPVVVGLRQVLDTGPWVLTALVVGLATGLAALSFELVEMPVRRSRRLAPYGFRVLAVGVATSLVVALAVVPPLLERDRLPAVATSAAPLAGTALNTDRPVPRDVDWDRYRNERGAGNHLCTTDDLDSCVTREGASGLHVAVVGDSHARQFAVPMERLAEEHDFTLSLHVLGGCPWQVGVRVTTRGEADPEKCAGRRAELYEQVLPALEPDVVVLSQNARDRSDQIVGADGGATAVDELNLRTMTETVEAIRGLGARVVIVETMLRPGGDDPTDPFNPLECLSGARRTSECRVPAPREIPVSDAIYRTLAIGDAGVETVNINRLMCPAWPVCDPMEGRIPVWRDSGHHSGAALVRHRAEIWEVLRETGFFDGAG